MHDSAPDPRLIALETRLAALAPAARLDRDRVMFAAGQRIGRRRLRQTQVLLGAASGVCAVLATLVIALPRDGRGRIETPTAEATAPVLADERVPARPPIDGPTNYRLLRDWPEGLEQVAYETQGPAADDPDASSRSRHTLLKQYLESTPGRL
jgi:hypothetical protein